MNTAPILRHQGETIILTDAGTAPKGFTQHTWQSMMQVRDLALSERNREQAFWQSRNTATGRRAELPVLTDIPALASAIRDTYPRGPAPARYEARRQLPLFSHGHGALGSAT